ncbi:IlvD/Edd family dehydratase [Pseudonocardia sp. WMMC193]|uniref:IlvD/Edd family dehydratase n=1 Tax=Pseudonocardia sp. WMMC193 TaxID=2911965 RepID=UPI001F48D455|nr:IlvD/Edd family dehydratase [Pseudonocardia sp. WMMC193]MCF7547894.1 dihydroxy-acid dehydratase [Pseudonocardia sp. WMMC193]
MTRLRSQDWFGGTGVNGFIGRSWLRNQGFTDADFDGRPVIGICSTWSELTPCNGHFRELAEHVKLGVREAGGVPVEFPVMSLGETILRPTSMLFRNLVSMEVEESVRANPLDGVVLLCGCDKTTPALLMGATSVDLPTIVLSGGPMLTGRFRGAPIGSGTAVFAMAEQVRAGTLTEAEFRQAESCMSRSAGHCNTMGTASTMACLTEALGMALPGNAALPAVDSRRRVLARETGARAVGLVREDLRPSAVLTRAAFANAVRLNAAIGGSTNTVVHLLALAGRAEVPLTLDDIDAFGRDIPLLVDLQPSGRGLMEDFFAAGGAPAVLRELAPLLDPSARTVTGRSIVENNRDAPPPDGETVRTLAHPLARGAGTAVLRGNLAPDGAVIKPSAASPGLLVHRGRAAVFHGMDDFRARIDDPDLALDEDSVLVLTGVGPRGYPGMPEVGNLPLPRYLLERGVTDLVRISDARMSGTAFGTVVLHVAPESAAGGPLALVQDGDVVLLDVPARRLHLDVTDEELARRRATWKAPDPVSEGGWQRLYVDHVEQADRGADLDFLRGRRGALVSGDNH